MYQFDNQCLLANGMSSLSLRENCVKPDISYYFRPFQHKRVAMMAVPPAQYQLINMDHIKVDGVNRPLVKGAQIRVHNCPAIHDYLKQLRGAARNVPACCSLIQKPSPLQERVNTRSSHWRTDSCFLVQSRSAAGRGKNLRCLSLAQICERQANLSLSQMETVNLPRSHTAEKSISKMPKAGQIKSPLERREFTPHPYDDIASRNIYLNTHSSFSQRQPCWNTSSPVVDIAKKPDQQLVKKIKRRMLKRKNRNESGELFLDNGKAITQKTHTVQQLMNILTSLSLGKAPCPPQEPREQRTKQRTADAHALVAWKNDPPAKLPGLCGWIGQSKSAIGRHQPLTPSPPRGPRRRVRKSRRARKLQVRGQGISLVPEMSLQT